MPTIEELKEKARQVNQDQVTQVPQTNMGILKTGPNVPGHEAPILASQQQVLTPSGEVVSNPIEALSTIKQSPNKRTYYSRFYGTTFCMPSGRLLSFIPYNGMSVYETEDQDEIRELNAVVGSSQAVITLSPVAVRQSDAHILREVGNMTGAANSQTLGLMSRQS